MSEVKTVGATGVITFWSVGAQTDLNRLAAAFRGIDLADYLPDVVSPSVALRGALNEVFPALLVRRLAVPGFAVVREARGPDGNTYSGELAVRLQDEALEFVGGNADECQRIQEAYNAKRGILGAAQVGKILTDLSTKHFGGTALRPAGGVYWINGDKLSAWQAVGDAIESACIKGTSAVHSVRHEMDYASCRAVQEAIIEEMRKEAQRIVDSVEGDDLKGRALESRQREARAAMSKLAEYERILGADLSTVRKALEDAETAAATAAMLLASGCEEATLPGMADTLSGGAVV